MRRIGKAIKMGLRLVLIFLLVYTLAIVVGSGIPTKKTYKQHKGINRIRVYIYSNGFHSFFILPVQSPERDWRDLFPLSDFKRVDSTFSHISLGWGDKAFFTETPTWEDFSLSTALAALFLPTSSVIQVHYLPRDPPKGALCLDLNITPEAYQILLKYLDNYLENEERGNPHLIKGKGYTSQDNFYQAKGKYSMFYTCNTWVSEGLATAGVRTPIWTPLDKGLFYQLKKIP